MQYQDLTNIIALLVWQLSCIVDSDDLRLYNIALVSIAMATKPNCKVLYVT